MAEWQNCGMAERRDGNRMAEMVEWRNDGMAEWREWRYGGKNGRIAERAVDRFSWNFLENGKPLRKIGKPLRKIGKLWWKAERRCGK